MLIQRLTHNSMLLFGDHAGLRVDQLLEEDSGRKYLLWLYFNASHIDYTDDILQELGIEHILNKPGRDPRCFETSYKAAC